jgi:2-amino-4-hydroxy-6-hydroxymethyldihydropteridine diphosphokinase
MRVVLGLGANLGDRAATLRAARQALEGIGRVEAVSRVYETLPVGGPAQPDFLNAAALLVFDGSPHALLDALQAIEAQFGRVRRERWGARTLDVDVLWIEGEVIADDRLTVPHPRLTERAFALVPLLDVAPGAIDPRTGEAFTSIDPVGVRVTDVTI